MVHGFVGPADSSESLATGPDMSDLPDVPLSEGLALLVADLHSGATIYRLTHVQSVIAKFFRAVGQLDHVYDAKAIDPYFCAVYNWFRGQPDAVRPSSETLREFWKRYSKESRELALYECMEKLKRIREAHTEASTEFTEALHAFMRGVITLEHEPYTIALEKLTVLNRELGHFTQAASVAAKAREFSNSFLFSS